MQVLHRQGEVSAPGAASDAGAPAPLAQANDSRDSVDVQDTHIIDHDLELRASQITAVAVATAAVTAAVVTTLAADEAAAASVGVGDAAALAPEPEIEAVPEPELQSLAHMQSLAVAASPMLVPPVRAILASVLTLASVALALWWGSQWPGPQRGLQPMAPAFSLPSLSWLKPAVPASTPLPASAPAATQPAAADAVVNAADNAAPNADDIARLQQQADDKAQQLAARRAQAQARHAREDAALAQREAQRRQAQAQLDQARARAERSQAAVPAAAPAEQAAAPSMTEQVAQCRALSLFARERCLWNLCDGKWGKDGCPSYQVSNEGA